MGRLDHPAGTLAQRRQLIGQPCRPRHIVKTDDGHFTRHIKTEFEAQYVHHDKRHVSIGHENRIRALILRLIKQCESCNLGRRVVIAAYCPRKKIAVRLCKPRAKASLPIPLGRCPFPTCDIADARVAPGRKEPRNLSSARPIV